MMALLRKDLRIYRGAIIAAEIVICLPYVIATLLVICGGRVGLVGITRIYNLASGLGLVAAMLVGAIFGGCAFAIERRERWGDFLAMMPVTRRSIVLSKIGIALTGLFAIWIIHASINFAVQRGTEEEGRFDAGYVFSAGKDLLGVMAEPLSSQELLYEAYVMSAAGIVLAFGISWLMSLWVRSPTIAACAGVGVLSWFFVQTQIDLSFLSIRALVALAFGVGCFCFFLGTILFLDRVEY